MHLSLADRRSVCRRGAASLREDRAACKADALLDTRPGRP
jgi:hypothetical protein